MPSFALIVKEREHIYIYLKLVLVKMDINWRYGIRKISKIISFKHLYCVHICAVTVFSIAWWVYEPQYSIAEAPIIRVSMLMMALLALR